ncbi:hypothetical protein T4B_10335 [Trichinella pseudospiralis]|uniref:Apple domain-containing protein n=1 Tax=Trichinella pseudospiralis TaxID=6337 RepID=A0A0V1IZ57_TRIPS|nr:hypothetical protein T4B_10335 [Trichinella pseudospiralis]
MNADSVRKEKLILINYEDTLRFGNFISEGYMHPFEEGAEENVKRISAVTLKATAEICIVERHPFSENFLMQRSGILFIQTLEMCLAHCRVLSMRGKCNAVLFSSDETVCLLLKQSRPLQAMMETSERRYYNGTGKIININRRLQCTVHKIPLLRAHMEHRTLLWNSLDFQNCIQFCGLQFQTNLCNAVYFEAEGTTCLHLLLNASQALSEYSENHEEAVHFIEKCEEVTERQELHQESAMHSSQSNEMLASLPAGEGSSRTCNAREQEADFLHYKAAENDHEQYVKLYEFYEICKVHLLYVDVIQNAFAIHVSRKVYSMNRCLHICRKQTSCIAVLFSRLNHECKKLFKGYSSIPITVHPHEEIAVLKECYKDRPDERRYNSDPLVYYFEQIQQICAAEIYNQKNLTSWEVMLVSRDIGNFQLCILNCIVTHQCSGINYFQTKECLLLKAAGGDYIFIVKDDSIFAELLYCEPGTLVDVIRQK